MRRILVTGASTWVGGRLVSLLERRGDLSVFAADEIEPRVPFSSPFAKLEMDRTELAYHLLDVAPEVVIHLLTVDRSVEMGSHRAHEEAIRGGQALFGAIGRSDTVRHVIVKSDAARYPVGPRNPSIMNESTPGTSSSRYGREIADIEQVVATVAPHHTDVTYTLLRLAPIFGADIGNVLSRFLTLPVVPTRLGFDPRLHLINQDDAVAAFIHALDDPVPGTFNVATSGPMYLSRLLRLGRRVAQPLPKRPFESAIGALGRTGLHIPSHLTAMLHHGLVIDTASMREDLGFTPHLNTRQTVLAGYGRRMTVGQTR